MEPQTELSELFYQDYHISCSAYTGILNTGFRHVELKPGQKMSSKSMPRHNLIMLISGAISISCNTHRGHTLREWQMILIPKSARFEAIVIESAEFVLFGFDTSNTSCDIHHLKSYAQICERISYDFKSTEIRKPMKLFLNLQVRYLESGVNCPHLCEAKHKELFICLKSFYSSEEVAYLMHPIIKCPEDFKSVILKNVDTFTCVNDMITITNTSRARFFVKFKKEFGVTAKQWMLKHQIERIEHAASTPNITVKELMFEFEFGGSAQFTQFCKLHLGCTPSALIRRYSSEKQDITAVEV